MKKVVPLVMLKYYKGINSTEIAGYPEDTAKSLVENEIARYYREEDKAKEVEKTLSIPEAQVMINVEDLMDCKVDDIKKELDKTVASGAYLYSRDYISQVVDYESLNKARSGLMEYLLEIMER